MPHRRSLLTLCLISAIGLGLCLAGAALNTPLANFAYAVLVTGEATPDREVRGRLSSIKLKGPIISESSQWFLLDDFNGVRQIPLDEYGSRLLPFDPRDDGYAKRLQSFFVRDGKRLLFIHLNAGEGKGLEKRLAPFLAGIPFSLEFIGAAKPLGFFFLLFCGASLAMASLRFFPFRWRLETLDVIFCLPALCPLFFYGAAGLGLASLLAGLAALLRESLLEFFTLFRYRDNGVFFRNKKNRTRLLKDAYTPYKFQWFLAPVLTLSYILLGIFSNASLLLALLVFFVFMGIFLFSLKTQSLRGDSQGHIRFMPVSIIKPAFNPRFAMAFLPFALAALVSGLASPAETATQGLPPSLQGALLSEDEYLAHAAFQSSFSYLPLGRDGAGYHAYVQGADGLIVPGQAGAGGHEIPDLPPFPLKGLMDFLSSQKASRRASQRGDKSLKNVYPVGD